MTSLLMVDPKNYKIEYAINPFMKNPDGSLKTVDTKRAHDQWNKLVEKYSELGLKVHVLESVPNLPDMVFSANQCFPFKNPKTGKLTVLMGKMSSEKRQPEVEYFQSWFKKQGYVIEHLTNPKWKFEGNGDALIHPGKNLIWGGYGSRTDKEVYSEISQRFGFTVNTLELVMPEFYHLDTCFAILDSDTVAIQKEAFSEEGLQKIRSGFKRIIEVDLLENLQDFCANCFSPNGKDVILNKGCTQFVSKLNEFGYTVHEVETDEFIKAGGSVFCLKMQLP